MPISTNNPSTVAADVPAAPENAFRQVAARCGVRAIFHT